MRIRFRVEYNGTPFHGWQKQPKTPHTLQEKIENALTMALRTPIEIIGSGRTDTGVHARGQMVHCDIPDIQGEMIEYALNKLQKSLNGILPPEIAIYNMQACEPDFHARFSALERQYIYRIQTRKSAFHNTFVWENSRLRIGHEINLDLMKNCAQHFTGTHDFDPFSIPRDNGKSTLCTLKPIQILHQNNQIQFCISGNRFLHGMIRSLVGCMLEAGKGKWNPDHTPLALQKQKEAPRIWAPPQGLTLDWVMYPDEIQD